MILNKLLVFLKTKISEAISNGQQLFDHSDAENKYTYPSYFSAYEDV